jgi:hypothetical protein
MYYLNYLKNIHLKIINKKKLDLLNKVKIKPNV